MVPSLMLQIKNMLSDIQGSGFDTSANSLKAICGSSVQRGIVTMSTLTVNVTISAINTDKAFLNFSFYYDIGSSGTAQIEDVIASTVRGGITSTTNVQFIRGDTRGDVYIAWQVIELV